MTDESSRLNVEVDGSSASRSIDRLTQSFNKLQSAVARTSSMFTALGSAGSGAFNRLRSVSAGAFRAMQAGFRGLQRAARAFVSVFRGLLKLIIGGGAAFTLFAKSVTTAGNQVNKFINTLVILKGDTSAASAELQELYNLSQRLGTSFSAAAQPFTKFAAAAAGTLGDRAIRDVFESFATVGVALQLTQSEVQGVFLALQQIASKGVVSMEELRLQLAERVPGAMRLAASSMDMTMADFEKAVAKRTINAGEFLERFAAKLKEVYGDAAALASTRLFADIQRLGNAMLEFRQKVFASGFEDGLKTLVRSAINFLSNNPELAEALGQFSKGIFEKVAGFLDSLNSDRVIGILNAMIGAFESLVNALNRVAFEFRKMFDDDFNDRVKEVEDQTRGLQNLIRARQGLMTQMERGMMTVQLGGSGQFAPTSIERPVSAEIRTEQENKLARLNEQIDTMRGLLVGARTEARELGIEFGQLPPDVLALIGDSSTSVGPRKVTFDRIQPVEGSTAGTLDLSNQPSLDFGTTATIQDALEQAERMSTMEMPEFYDKLVSGELRAAMSDLERVTLDLNVANESQGLLLKKIKDQEEALNQLRGVGDNMTNEQAAELNQMRQKLIELTEKYLEQEERRIKLKEEQLKLMDQEDAYLARFKSFQEELEESMTSTRETFINMIRRTEDSIVDFVATGKFSFKDLADSIIRELARMAVQAFLTRYVLGPLLGGMSDAVGTGLGGPFAQPTPSGATIPTNPPTLHTGGIVGGTGQQFDSLKSNERAAILEKGEGVFTQGQMAAMASLSDVAKVANRPMNPAHVSKPVVNVHQPGTRVEVHNHASGVDPQIETETASDGSELIRVIINAVSDDISKDGQLSRIMKGKYGLRNRTSTR